MKLKETVTKVPLIGDTKSKQLEKLGIQTVRDLLFHVPAKYRDTTTILPIDILKLEKEGTILARVKDIKTSYTRSRLVITKTTLEDENSSISAVWFNQPYLQKTFKKGDWYLFEGKIGNRGDLSNPSYEKYTGDIAEQKHIGRIASIYPQTAGISSKWLRSRIDAALKEVNLGELEEAIYQIHFPESEEKLTEARKRLAYDELLGLAIQIEQAKKDRKQHEAPILEEKDINPILRELDFKLTDDQKKAVDEILEDIKSDNQMYRLLNGDVGSGKTIVAAIAAYASYTSGYSTLLMAPTTILANQHYSTLNKLFSKLNIKVELRVGGGKLEEKKGPRIIVGTHALLFEDNLPEKVGLLIVDEQHRFGVEQRKELLSLNPDNTIPHYLSMTATPIPRSLTNVLFGDMDVSVIKELPTGRKEIKSHLVPFEKRDGCYSWVKERIQESNLEEQAFIIFPLIDESDSKEMKAAKKEFEELKKDVFKDLKVGLLHGQMKQKEKDKVMEAFKEKKYNILVSTTVIEVGIDIPDATIMVIENAETFGLAQLHQLRGRVGRSDKESFCYVVTGESVEKEGAQWERLGYFVSHNSGFDVANYDLEHRGPGEVYGNKQSGLPNFKIASFSDIDILKSAREEAKSIIEKGDTDKVLEKLFR